MMDGKEFASWMLEIVIAGIGVAALLLFLSDVLMKAAI